MVYIGFGLGSISDEDYFLLILMFNHKPTIQDFVPNPPFHQPALRPKMLVKHKNPSSIGDTVGK